MKKKSLFSVVTSALLSAILLVGRSPSNQPAATGGQASGVFFPKGTPENVIKKWEGALEKASRDPAFQDELKAINAQIAYLNAADLGKFVKEETANYTDIATKKGLRK